MKSDLVRSWPHPRSVDLRDGLIRVDSLPVAAWDDVQKRFVCSEPARAGLSEAKLEALLDQTLALPADEIALMIEIRLEQLAAD